MVEGMRVFTDAIQDSPSGCKNSIARLLQKDVRRARYLDPKTSRWLSADPALGEYMAGSKAGVGGIYNQVNLNLYHYAGNNSIKYTDPDGKSVLGKVLGYGCYIAVVVAPAAVTLAGKLTVVGTAYEACGKNTYNDSRRISGV